MQTSPSQLAIAALADAHVALAADVAALATAAEKAAATTTKDQESVVEEGEEEATLMSALGLGDETVPLPSLIDRVRCVATSAADLTTCAVPLVTVQSAVCCSPCASSGDAAVCPPCADVLTPSLLLTRRGAAARPLKPAQAVEG